MRYRGLETEFENWNRLFNSIFSGSFLFDDKLDSFFGPSEKLPSAISVGNWLPSNIYVGDDKSYNVDIAVAGIPKEKVDVDLKEDYVVVSFNGGEASATEAGKGDAESVEAAVSSMETRVSVANGKRYIQRNIKEPKGKQTLSFFIDNKYYDVKTLKASLKDGILHIEVKPHPKPEIEASTKIAIE